MSPKKTLAVLLAVIMVMTLLPTAALALGYSDVSGHWACPEIDRWSSLGILRGSDGEFRPDEPITRAEMATILDRTMLYRDKAQNSFTDLGTNWYTDAMLRANRAGVIKGDGSFLEFYLKLSDAPELVENGKYFITLTPKAYTQDITAKDYAGDEVTTPLTLEALTGTKDVYATFTSAVYSSANSTLTLTFNSDHGLTGRSTYACFFTVTNGSITYNLRGVAHFDWYDHSKIIINKNSINHIPKDFWGGATISYGYSENTHPKPSVHSVLSYNSGKPYEGFTNVKITAAT